MDELTIEHYENIKTTDPVLFFKTPFCGTCQLAEKLLELTFQTMGEDTRSTYICRAEEWQPYIEKWQIESVPCLVFTHDGNVTEKVYAFESVTKLYQLYKAHH